MNADINVGFIEGCDQEIAKIQIRSFGGVGELRFENGALCAVAEMGSVDLARLLEVLRMAEEKRVDPDERTLEALKYLESRYDFLTDDQSQLRVDCELEMPISSCGSVLLEPKIKTSLPGASEGEE